MVKAAARLAAVVMGGGEEYKPAVRVSYFRNCWGYAPGGGDCKAPVLAPPNPTGRNRSPLIVSAAVASPPDAEGSPASPPMGPPAVDWFWEGWTLRRPFMLRTQHFLEFMCEE
jgi:hypothetical protein